MQFQVGARVVHPVHGVGTVKALTEQQFSGATKRRYYEVTTEGPTVWVPIDKHGHSVLREIASKASLAECRDALSGHPLPFDSQRQVRQQEIAERLKSGLLPALCEMVRDLRARNWGTTLGVTEQDVLRRISRMLCDEWAAAAGVSHAHALGEIEDLLHEGSLSWIPSAGERRQVGNELAGW